MDTSERLIRSTQELLWDRGYVGTSPKAIQQHAEAGQGSMYHHFAGKSDLALAAIRRSAEELRAEAEAALSGPGTAREKIGAYLRRERDVLRGCRIGRLAQDPDIIASAELRQPVQETLEWLQRRLSEVISEGKRRGELRKTTNPEATAAMIAAVVQGGYVLARAANEPEPFERAIEGVGQLLDGD
ncbi:AcrR family transcriptional regulator [Amycolatopsis endophytica]|uniref:AcrR family transcriptional regulator n=1 Tax=Amycolatopsis endophytica TaxID=860233 RepID=A0A853B3U6_9PSEU|nr:TetR/AcrR family transcriptional regulator [Amycolatopsis endophytica]NYI89306.1 AcrR family transcriptional regulator [Amycolatopsis endophytica]